MTGEKDTPKHHEIPEADTTQSDDYLPTDEGVESFDYDDDPKKRGGGSKAKKADEKK